LHREHGRPSVSPSLSPTAHVGDDNLPEQPDVDPMFASPDVYKFRDTSPLRQLYALYNRSGYGTAPELVDLVLNDDLSDDERDRLTDAAISRFEGFTDSMKENVDVVSAKLKEFRNPLADLLTCT